MKKFFSAFGSSLGISLFVIAQMEISDNWSYTWTPPFTNYEILFLTMKWGGIILASIGFLCLLSSLYENSQIRDINSDIKSSKECPSCGCVVEESMTSCPNCQHNFTNSNLEGK